MFLRKRIGRSLKYTEKPKKHKQDYAERRQYDREYRKMVRESNQPKTVDDVIRKYSKYSVPSSADNVSDVDEILPKYYLGRKIEPKVEVSL